jgi:hypothetical protein
MKTPRKILLERHRAALPKLDAIRETVVAAAWNRRTEENNSTTAPDRRYGLHDFFRSLRWHFAAMSALWMLAVLLNADHSPGPAANIAAVNIPAPQKILASLQENRRLLLQLIEPPASVPAIPPRRSELQLTTAIV